MTFGSAIARPIVLALVTSTLAACTLAGGASSSGEQADAPAHSPPTAPVAVNVAMDAPKGCVISASGPTEVAVTIPDRPGLVASDHWFTGQELAELGDGFGSLLLSCTSAEADVAAWSTEALPMQPGTYAVGLTGPFTVSGRLGPDQVAPTTDGELTIERFDLGGVTATMTVDMSAQSDPGRTYQVVMSVHLRCRGLSLCAGAPSVNP